jgi:cell division protein FtsI/penicillin-binding protein 2
MLLTNGANNYSYLIYNHSVGVKSGTAQVDDGKNENSLLVGFCDDPDLPVAFCILIENTNITYMKTEYIAQVLLDSLAADLND